LKNLIIPISIGLLCTAFAISPTARRTNAAVLPHAASGYLLDSSNALSPATNIYQSMNLQMLGMSKKAFDDAWEGYTYLIANQKIKKISISLFVILVSLHQKSVCTLLMSAIKN
jgi:hypothetical protein